MRFGQWFAREPVAREDGDIGQLAIHFALTASTRTLFQEHLAGLDKFSPFPIWHTAMILYRTG